MARRSSSSSSVVLEHPILPGFESLKPVEIGDPLGRCYTPDTLAAACLAAALSYYDDTGRDYPSVVIEPSCGGGSFLRAVAAVPRLSHAHTVGVDLDPLALGLRDARQPITKDWCEAAPELARAYKGQDTIIIGNPPFDDPPRHTVARDHVRAAITEFPGALLALLLPLGYLGVAGWDSFLSSSEDRLDLWRVVGRPWPERLREVALFVWRPSWHVHTLGSGGGLRRLPWRS